MLAAGLLRLLCAMVAVLPLAAGETISLQFRVSPDEAFVLSADSADELSLSGSVKAIGYQCEASDAELCARYSELKGEVASLRTQFDALANSIAGLVPDTAAPELLDMEVAASLLIWLVAGASAGRRADRYFACSRTRSLSLRLMNAAPFAGVIEVAFARQRSTARRSFVSVARCRAPLLCILAAA